MKKHSSHRAHDTLLGLSRGLLIASSVAVALAALAACDLHDGDCEDELVGARYIVTPSPDGRVAATVTVNDDDDAGARGTVDAAADAPAPVADAATDAARDADSTADGSSSDASARGDSGAPGDGGSVYGGDLSCAEICRLGFGPSIDLIACRGPFQGERRTPASSASADAGTTELTSVTYADCEGVATVCRGPERRHGMHRDHR